MSRVRLTPSASVTPTTRGVILASDLGAFQITGPDAAAFARTIVPLLDGSRDREAVAAASGYAKESVLAFLDLLTTRGLVEDAPDTPAPDRWEGQRELFRRWGVGAGAQDKLARATVSLTGLTAWGAAAAIELAAAGLGALRIIDGGPARRDTLAARVREAAPWCSVEVSGDREKAAPATLWIAAEPPDDLAAIEQTALLAQRTSTPTLHAHLSGAHAFLGPLVIPGRTACRVCASIDSINPALTAPPAEIPSALAALLGQLLASAAVSVITGAAPPPLGGHLLIIEALSLSTSHHKLTRLPWCRVCGAD